MDRRKDNLLLNEVKADIEKRNIFIEQNKSFIFYTASNVCKRSLQWENDEELSIALLAFNEAIDTFENDKSNFLSFAKLVIQRRLIDYFRKEKKQRTLSLDKNTEDNGEFSLWEANSAINQYNKLNEQQERINAIKSYNEYLKEFGISFAELIHCSPKHNDTRQALINASRKLCRKENIIDTIFTKKRLPIIQITLTTSLSRKMVKTWRKYIIALLIVFRYDELFIIREFLDIKGGEIDEA